MRINFLKAGGWGNTGGDRVIAIHAENLCHMGHDVSVIAMPPFPQGIRSKIKSIIKNNRYSISGENLFDNASFKKIILNKNRALKNKDLPDADILVTTWFETAEWAENIDLNKGRKVSFIQGYEAFNFIPIDRLNKTWLLPHPKIVISKWLYELAQDKFKCKDVHLVENSVDRSQFKFFEREKNVVPTVGFLYHTLPEKGAYKCLKVFENLSQKFESINLITFGHGCFSPNLPSNVSHEHFDNPDRGFIGNIYSKCDVWLCASMSEGFYLPHLEAMACGCPVVSTMVGGPLDNIVDGENGFLVPIDNIEELYQKSKFVLNMDNERWKLMSRRAADTKSDYSWKNASERFEACLQEVLRKKL